MIVRGEGEITVSNKAGVIRVNEQKHADQYGINKLEHGRIGVEPRRLCPGRHMSKCTSKTEEIVTTPGKEVDVRFCNGINFLFKKDEFIA